MIFSKSFAFSERGIPGRNTSNPVKLMSIDIGFTGLLVFRPGIPLSENAKALLKIMRIQMDADIRQLQKVLGRKKR